MADIGIFALKADLVALLTSVEAAVGLQYIVSERKISSEPTMFSGVEALRGLGSATHESSAVTRAYLICQRGSQFRARLAGDGHYRFDQLFNPDTVVFAPGGLWGAEFLISGRFATLAKTEFAQGLMKLLRREIRKRFEKIKSYHVGQEAAHLLDDGKRHLTIAAQSPSSFWLSRE